MVPHSCVYIWFASNGANCITAQIAFYNLFSTVMLLLICFVVAVLWLGKTLREAMVFKHYGHLYNCQLCFLVYFIIKSNVLPHGDVFIDLLCEWWLWLA